MRTDRRPNDGLNTLDTLLRGEIAAAETYQQALEKTGDDPEIKLLRTIQQDHGDAIRYLYDSLAERGQEPSNRSGPWGAFARAIEKTAVILGNKAALAALREGEERGLSAYARALARRDLPAPSRQHIANTLLPQQRRHIDILSRLLARA